jgi:DNA-binding MarR family transcriptional regulator
MSIEKDINQSRFHNEYHKLNVNLIYTYNWMMERSKKFFENADLTVQQYNVLRILRGSGKPLSTMQLRQRMLDKMSDTSRIVDRMLKKELVEKIENQADRRLVDITISKKGMSLVNRLDKNTHELYSNLRSLSEDEAQMLNVLLDKLRNSG